MSELKAFRIIQGDTGGYGAPSYKCDTDGNRIDEWSDVCEVYDRFEADKVLAEKDKEIRHHKYKQCLDMAKYCKAMCGHYLSYEEPKWFWYRKWSERWLELAEKFKEAK